MATIPFLRPAPGWSLSSDGRQWILNRVDESTNKHWPVAFVATSKAVLMRVLRETGVEIEPPAQRALGALPGTFGEWLAERGAGQQP